MEIPASLSLPLPPWLTAWARGLPGCLPDDSSAMRVAVETSERSFRENTGGPFGAVIVDERDRTPLAVGVNAVLSARSSLLHAEILAILLAQARLRTHDLSLGGTRRFTLYTSAEPCAMCMGAIPWSGLRRVVCAARDEDVRAVGFDEGAKPPDWPRTYEQRGISVSRDCLRDDACRVLNAYAAQGGRLY